jgi:hypothetical protein
MYGAHGDNETRSCKHFIGTNSFFLENLMLFSKIFLKNTNPSTVFPKNIALISNKCAAAIFNGVDGDIYLTNGII